MTQLRLQAVLDALAGDLAWLAAQRESLPVAVRRPTRGSRGRLAALVVRQVLNQFRRLFLPALDFDDFRDQDVIGSFN